MHFLPLAVPPRTYRLTLTKVGKQHRAALARRPMHPKVSQEMTLAPVSSHERLGKKQSRWSPTGSDYLACPHLVTAGEGSAVRLRLPNLARSFVLRSSEPESNRHLRVDETGMLPLHHQSTSDMCATPGQFTAMKKGRRLRVAPFHPAVDVERDVPRWPRREKPYWRQALRRARPTMGTARKRWCHLQVRHASTT